MSGRMQKSETFHAVTRLTPTERLAARRPAMSANTTPHGSGNNRTHPAAGRRLSRAQSVVTVDMESLINSMQEQYAWLREIDSISLRYCSPCSSSLYVCPTPDSCGRATLLQTRQGRFLNYELLVDDVDEPLVRFSADLLSLPVGTRRTVYVPAGVERASAAVKQESGSNGPFTYKAFIHLVNGKKFMRFEHLLAYNNDVANIFDTTGRVLGQLRFNQICALCHKYPVDVDFSENCSELDKVLLLDMSIYLMEGTWSSPIYWLTYLFGLCIALLLIGGIGVFAYLVI